MRLDRCLVRAVCDMNVQCCECRAWINSLRMASRHGDMALIGWPRTKISVVGVAWMLLQQVLTYELSDSSTFVAVDA